MPKTFAQLSEEVILDVFPDGQPENLVRPHRNFIVEALREICRFTDCFKEKNTNVHPFCATYFTCGATVVDKPPGKIQRIYTLHGDCCPIFYDNIEDYNEFLNWLIARRLKWTEPPNLGMPALPMGFKYAEDVTDKGLRFQWGRYCIHNDRIYVGHRIESTEKLVIEWNGNKRDYSDDDFVPEEVEVARAVEHYLRAQHALRYESDPRIFTIENDLFLNTRGTIIYDCEQEKRAEIVAERQYDQLAVQNRGSSCQPVECRDEAVENETELVAGIMGNFGDASDPEQDVATLIDSWNPDFVVSLGGNWFGSSLLAADLDAKSGAYYRRYIAPYRGTAGDQVATEQQFFPAIGSSDRDPDGRFEVVRDYFTLLSTLKNPPMPSKGYYEFRKGPVHFFIVDSGYDLSNVNQQDDGIASGSIQANWLRIALVQSNAPWKVVVLYHAPYSSTATATLTSPLAGDGTLSYPALRWPFVLWGAHLVISGGPRNYERLFVSGLNYMIAGTGGHASMQDFADPALGTSQTRYKDNYGAIQLLANKTAFSAKFINIAGTEIDELTMLKTTDATAPIGRGPIGVTTPTVIQLPGPALLGINYRFINGYLEVKNSQTGKWLPFDATGADGEGTLGLGPEET